MLLAAGLKDAVTLYEVYLEQAFDEVLLRHGAERRRKDSPRWPELRDYYLLLGVDLFTHTEVASVRRLRHLLTHRRGAVENEADETAFGATYLFPAATVELTSDVVSTAMATLAASVDVIETVVYEYSWGSRRIEDLVIGDSRDSQFPS